MRGVGVTEWLVDLVPPSLVPLLVGLTFLGDTAFLAVLAPLAYWLGPRGGVLPRRDGARVLAVTAAAFGLVVVLKHAVAVGRPPASWHLVPKAGFAFPSGHATGSAAVYAALAACVRWRDRRTRVALAAALTGVVGVTRLLLGVHYLVDVLAGWAAGALLAAIVLAVTRADAAWGFRAAFAVAGLAAVVGWPAVDAAAAFGGATGAWLAWETVSDRLPTGPVSPGAALLGLVTFGGLAAVAYWVALPLAVVVAANTVAGMGFVGVPLAQNFSR